MSVRTSRSPARQSSAPDLLTRGHDEYVRQRREILREELAVLGEHAPDEAIALVEQRIAERLDGPV
jgi:hypothetical protein